MNDSDYLKIQKEMTKRNRDNHIDYFTHKGTMFLMAMLMIIIASKLFEQGHNMLGVFIATWAVDITRN